MGNRNVPASYAKVVAIEKEGKADKKIVFGDKSVFIAIPDLVFYYENSSFFWTLSGVMKPSPSMGFSPPWCDMTYSYCSLQEIPIMSYLPDSYKVRSGPGVSGVSLPWRDAINAA
jgi:hypothetical protein